MRIVEKEADFKQALESAQREAKNAFGNDKVLLEKYITNPRHIEVQLVSDGVGNHFHFFERECSIQRRYQKVVEESPACGVDEELRQRLCDTAVKIAKNINYLGAGTIEYILAKDNQFYFLEMNTRLQVEHPITEMVTGFDLVELQILAARGEAFSFKQSDISQYGHAIEARIYAEDPDREFLPTSGEIQKISLKENVNYRLDCSIRDGGSISLNYDPMLAKVIVHSEERSESIQKMQDALDDVVFGGVVTNRKYLKRIMANDTFFEGSYNTNFINQESDRLGPWKIDDESKTLLFAGGFIAPLIINNSEFIFHRPFEKEVKINGEELLFKVNFLDKSRMEISFMSFEYHFSIEVVSGQIYLINDNREFLVHDYPLDTNGERQVIVGPLNANLIYKNKANYCQGATSLGEGSLVSPMPGKIFKVMSKIGQTVKAGEPLLIMEAMKMEHIIKASTDGVIKNILFKEGEQVMGGVQLIEIES